jgi:hypothetical protein
VNSRTARAIQRRNPVQKKKKKKIQETKSPA